MGLDLKLQPGDLVFLSFGIRYLGYANRVGRWAYLLPTGESAAPPWVDEAMANLADAADRVVGALAVGQGGGDVDAALVDALAGLDAPAAVVDRVGRLRDGAVAPSVGSAPTGAWGDRFTLPSGAGLAITIGATVAPPGGRPFELLLLDTARVAAAGGGFVVPLQRSPLLID